MKSHLIIGSYCISFSITDLILLYYDKKFILYSGLTDL